MPIFDDQSRVPAFDACKKGSTGELMKRLGQRYVQYINRTYGRGFLWEGR